MKHGKLAKAAGILLIAAMLLQLLPMASAYGTCSSWAEASLSEIDSVGLIPESLAEADMTLNITRRELCQMAVIAYRKITGRNDLTPDKTTYFTDTTDADICLAYELGIVSGYENGKFGPDDKLTRQELFQIIYSLFKSVGWSEDEVQEMFKTFLDYKKVGDWAVESTKIMLELGITTGTGGNYITPAGTTTVEQALLMLERVYDYARYYLAEAMGPFTGIDPATLPPRPEADEIPDTHLYSACSSWAEHGVGIMEVWELIPESLFGLDFSKQNITREQFCEAAVLCYRRLTGDESPAMQNTYFKDTSNPDVCRAYELQIVAGYTDKTFRPNNSITRQEMFTMILSLLKSVGWEKYDNEHELFAQYSDSGNIASWAKAAAKVAIELEFVKGNGSGKLMPTGTCSREQAAIMFYNAFRYIDLWYSEHPLNPETYPGHIAVDNPKAQQAVDLAVSRIGCWYVYGDEGPNTFDCSGLVYWVYHTKLGYSMGRTATAQWRNGIEISVDWSHPGKYLKPGDLVYFRTSSGSSSIGHIGIYVGATYDGKPTPYGEFTFIHAPHTGAQVGYGDLHWYINNNRIYGARRIAY